MQSGSPACKRVPRFVIYFQFQFDCYKSLSDSDCSHKMCWLITYHGKKYQSTLRNSVFCLFEKNQLLNIQNVIFTHWKVCHVQHVFVGMVHFCSSDRAWRTWWEWINRKVMIQRPEDPMILGEDTKCHHLR